MELILEEGVTTHMISDVTETPTFRCGDGSEVFQEEDCPVQCDNKEWRDTQAECRYCLDFKKDGEVSYGCHTPTEDLPQT